MGLKIKLFGVINSESHWAPAKKVLFKFIFLYFLLFGNPFSFLYQDLIILLGKTFMDSGIEIQTNQTGSGDKLIHWLFFGFNLFSALLGAIIWTIFDRNQYSYNRLSEVLYILVRYFLAFTLIGYGIVKIIPSQFQEPGFIRLTEEFGNSSPMGLAWTFFGFKDGYQMFSGIMEALGGSLILFRRTTLLGALLSVGVMLNVFMVNLFFDVPVKILSGHLLIFCIGIALLNIRSLYDYFILHKPVSQHLRPFPIQDSDWRKIFYAIKTMIISGIVGIQIYAISSANAMKPNAPIIAGIYHITSFELDKSQSHFHVTDSLKWRRVVIDDERPGLMAIDFFEGNRIEFRADINEQADSIHAELPVKTNKSSSEMMLLNVEYEISDSTLTFRGNLDGLYFKTQMTRREPDDILLISRGFNFVNELPLRR